MLRTYLVMVCVCAVLGRRQVPCHLEELNVPGQHVDWKKVGRLLHPDEIVIFPPELKIWTCIGSCPYRNKNSLFFTEHARILSAIDKHRTKNRRAPLCTPAKLKPMNINVFNNITSRLRPIRLKHASATACQCS
jgi:hypothetical protein